MINTKRGVNDEIQKKKEGPVLAFQGEGTSTLELEEQGPKPNQSPDARRYLVELRKCANAKTRVKSHHTRKGVNARSRTVNSSALRPEDKGPPHTGWEFNCSATAWEGTAERNRRKRVD